jgi:hypothetical protein
MPELESSTFLEKNICYQLISAPIKTTIEQD